MAYNYDPFSQGDQEKKDSMPKKAVKKGADVAKNKIKRQVAKKASKLILSAVKKGLVVLTKALLAMLATIGLPAILVTLGIVLLVIIIIFTTASIFGSGSDLDSSEQDMYDHIVAESNSTVNLDNPEQAPYKVPVELLSSAVQLDALQDDDHFAIVTEMADVLAPTFTYSDDFNEWTETQTRSCKEGEECEAWSDITRVDNPVSKLVNIKYWQGEVNNTYIPYSTAWTTTVRSEYVTETETVTVTEEYTENETRYRTVFERIPYEETIYEEKEVTRTYLESRPIPFPPWELIIKRTITETIKVPRTVTRYKEVERIIEYEVPVQKTREVEKEVEVVKEIKHYTKKRHQLYRKQVDKNEDYIYLDTALNSMGFGYNDKRLLEVTYNFQDKSMDYIAWLDARGNNGGTGGGAAPFPGTIVPGSDIPTQYMQHYLDAEAEYGVHWYMLASIHSQETVFSTHEPMVSSAGAEGHMQFMPCTWVGWSYPGCSGTNGNTHIPVDIKDDPAVISRYGGYGTDANGDGIASPWDIEDAIHSAARYLAASGYENNVRGAVRAYNHADWYVNEVVERSERYKVEAVYTPLDIPDISPGTFTRPVSGAVSSQYGNRFHPNDHVWRLHAGIDVGASGRTDVPIIAAADGEVMRAEYTGGWGNTIVIRHEVDGKRIETLYAHLSSYGVGVGQEVKKGEFIGIMGNTGNSTGPHLHFEFHIGGVNWDSVTANTVNPALYVPF